MRSYRSLNPARLTLCSVSAFLLLALPTVSSATTLIYDQEAERAIYEGMDRVKTFGITNLIAEDKYDGEITFRFSAPTSGKYLIEAKTIAPDKQSNSFWVRVNDEERVTWHVPISDTWQWHPVKLYDKTRGMIELSSGDHEITFYGREKTHLDRIKIFLVEDHESDETETTLPSPTQSEPTPEPSEPETTDLESSESSTERLTGNVWYVAASGSNDNDGTQTDSPLASINEALQHAVPGDTVAVASGQYREEVVTVRSGTAEAPITITALDPTNPPVLDLDWSDNAPIIRHSHIVLEHFEISNFDEGVRIDGGDYVTFRNNHLHHGENECLRVWHNASHNTITDNTINFCGATSATDRIEGGNGEGIYIGTAPEQRHKYLDDKPDESTHNVITNNTIYDVTEGIDLKEDAHFTLVKNNLVYAASDSNSGAINIRGDENEILDNIVRYNQSSGIRLGGDSDTPNGGGERHDYGQNNLVAGNQSLSNEQFGYKFMHQTQNFDCSNVSKENQRGHSNTDTFSSCF